MKISPKILILIGFCLLVSAFLAACGASQKEANQTYYNRQAINDQIPVPPLNFSSRRLVLAKYYLVLGRPRLNTCSYFVGRGSYGEAVAPTFGPSVNLSNQMTDPDIAEADSVYTGPNDQTVSVLRNGNFATVEADVITVGGECPPQYLVGGAKHLDTPLQTLLDFSGGENVTPEFDFTNTDGLKP